MKSFLLIRPLCEGDEPEFAEPLGIERLAGYLRAHGVHDVRIADRRLSVAERRAGVARDDAPGFFDGLRLLYPGDAFPQVIGLSLMTAADVADARRIVSRLHAWWPEARFVAGGIYVTGAFGDAARAFPPYVHLIAGEGETALLALAQGGGCSPSDTCDAACNATDSPDDWACAYRPDLERYAALGCAVNIQASRGCPGVCAFCATPSLPPALRRWQPRDVRLVADEVQEAAERLQAAGLPPVFNFVDDDFGPLERLEALAAEFAARSLRIAFACEMRLASLAGQPNLEERLANLHAAGLTRLFIGVESVNRQTLARWRKPVDLEALPHVLAACRAAGLTVQAGYILWHAGQTIEGALAEARQLRDLGLYTHRAALSRLIVFPGCALAVEKASEQGFQSLAPEAEEFYRRFAAAAADITRIWTKAAIAEPYAAAVEFLTGDDAPIAAIRHALLDANARSFDLMTSLASQME